MKEFGYMMAFFLLLGCSYEEDPLSYITLDEFFQEPGDAQSAVDAIYSHIHSGESVYATTYCLLNGLASDLGEYRGSNPDLGQLSNFTFSSRNKIIEEIWTKLYAGIAAANFAIFHIPFAPISLGEQEELILEARFLRTIFYFDLMRFFGSVPLVLEPFDTETRNHLIPRTALDSIQDFIESEFTEAFNSLPSSNDLGRPTNLTAAAYLSKFYLTIKDYNRAFQASRQVVRSERFVLLPDYATLFLSTTKNSSEDLWSANINDELPHRLSYQFLPPEEGGYGHILPTAFHRESFGIEDRRASSTIIDPEDNTFWEHPWIAKYQGRTVDIHLIRYADVLLSHAEALNEVRNGSNSESLAAINQVRSRARFDGVNNGTLPADLTQMNKSDFRDAILAERAREVAWEGHRWFDLVRFGNLVQAVRSSKPKTQVDSHHSLLPIPQREFELNPNLGAQNPGY